MNWIDIKGADVLIKKLGKLKQHIDHGKIPFLLAGDLRAMIESRSKKGQGLRGGWPEYSTAQYYRSKKTRPIGRGGRRVSKKNGRALKTIAYDGGYKQFAKLTKGSSRPNLSANNDMFRAFQAMNINKEKAMLHFVKQKEAFKALVNNRRRPFVGATKRERAKLNRTFAGLLNTISRQAGLT